MENLRLREAAPTSVNVTVGKRSREYLTGREVERLIEAAKQNRAGYRDATAILVAYRHGLRAAELVALTHCRAALNGILIALSQSLHSILADF